MSVVGRCVSGMCRLFVGRIGRTFMEYPRVKHRRHTQVLRVACAGPVLFQSRAQAWDSKCVLYEDDPCSLEDDNEQAEPSTT